MASARRNGMRARGQALVWYAAQPPWLEPALKAAGRAERETLMTSYIDTAIRRYAGKIREWDVVNEAIEPNDGRADGMRRSEEHTSELQSLMRISYAVFCLKKQKPRNIQ